MTPDSLPIRDIHLPDSIGWWPPAFGWWLLAVLVPLLAYLGYRLYRRLTRKTAVREAREWLRAIQQDRSRCEAEKLKEISVLLRRTAISIFPRSEVAGLTGKDWLEFLDRACGKTLFARGEGMVLLDGPYKKHCTADIDSLLALCENWLSAVAGRVKC
ncbi:MAG: DUF4381 domain-containing protein [Gammaproteobacteria bacterium]